MALVELPLVELSQVIKRYGSHTVFRGGAFGAQESAPMRIAFNYIPDLETESDEGADPIIGKGRAKKRR